MTDTIDLLPTLEPQREGLAKLRQSIRRREHHATARAPWYVAALTLSVAMVVVVGLAFTPQAIQRREFRHAVSQALRTQTHAQTRFEHGAWVRIPSGRSDVRILLVGTLPKKARSPTSGTRD